MSIAVLDQTTINQIAAGEVVERPASVVKELIENAIDAGASAITAEIREGGIHLIRITDNGCGIEKEEVPLAFLRHSTSKIRSVEDLMNATSLGFRGEALSSIAAIAQVELVTKTRTSFTGVRYLIDGGEEKGCFEIGCPEGTTFLVRNMFYNTPARRKFLKSPTTEAGYISDLMERLAVSHPEISFKFINNNKTVLHTSGNRNLKDIIYHVYGREIAAQLLPVMYEGEDLSIGGFLGKPVISRGNRNYENYFINGRYIRSNILYKAIEEAYKPYTMQHKYPFTVLHLTIDGSKIDVNVHPTKMELRFSDTERVYRAVYQAVKDTLSGRNLIPDALEKEKTKERPIFENIPEPFEKNRILQTEGTLGIKGLKPAGVSKEEINRLSESAREKAMEQIRQSGLFENETISVQEQKPAGELLRDSGAAAYPAQTSAGELLRDSGLTTYSTQASAFSEPAILEPKQETLFSEEKAEEKKEAVRDAFLKKDSVKRHRIIGQVFSTYWLVEFDQQLFIIDQHAAHEKILYERTLKRLKDKEYLAQMVSPPIILTLSMREEEAIAAHKSALEQMGFTIEAFGGKEYAVRSVPADMFGLEGKELLLEFIDELVEDAPKQAKTPDLILERIASLSCKAAVKGRNKLSVQEAQALIDELMTLENPFHCPHGRPVIVSMTQQEIEKKFRRIL